MLIKPEEYLERLKSSRRVVYVFGRRVEDFTSHPNIRPIINSFMETYRLALMDKYKGILTAVNEEGEEINRFLHVAKSPEDLVKRVEMMRIVNSRIGTCNYRCTGHDAINALYPVTYEIDEKYGTEYHRRFRRFLREAKRNDYAVTGAMTDVKGDRARRPSEQEDPDLYLRVVEERRNGIVVRGAKIHQSGAVAADYIIVIPTRAMRPEEAQWSVSFAVPGDSKGLIYVHQWNSYEAKFLLREEHGLDIDIGNLRYGIRGTGMVIFNDVFVPWDNVFMYGETEFTGRLIEYFSAHHRGGGAGCKAGFGDVLIGAAALAATYEGVEKAGHIRNKLAYMSYLNEKAYSTGLAAAYKGVRTASGSYIPDPLLSDVAKLAAAEGFPEMLKITADIAGGLAVTGPSELDLRNPEVGKLVKKYLKTRADVDVEDRLRVYRLIENWVASPHMVGAIQGGGPPQTQLIGILRKTDFARKMELAKRIAGIE